MDLIKIMHRISVTCICGLLLVGCSIDLADTGSGVGTGNPVITGIVYTKDGKPAAGAIAVLRKSDFLKDTSLSAVQEIAFDSNETVLSEDGRFRFDSLDTGAYFIEVTLGGASAVLLSCKVTPADTLVLIPNGTLSPVVIIEGVISLYGGPSTNRYIQVYGLDRVVKTDADGIFRISVPLGLFTLRIVTGDADYPRVEIPYAAPDSGSVAVSILSERPISTDYVCDTMIIRAILDRNGLQIVSAVSIIGDELENGRVSEIHFSGAAYSVMPNLIGGLNTLHEFYLQNTAVSSLPVRIGALVNLEELQLTNNELSTLPKEIVNLTKVTEADLSGNRLANLPPEVKAWADIHDPDWESTQDSQ